MPIYKGVTRDSGSQRTRAAGLRTTIPDPRSTIHEPRSTNYKLPSVGADVAAAVALDGVHARVGGADDLVHVSAVGG